MSTTNTIRCLTERAIVRALIRECLAGGWIAHQVDDGEDLVRVRSENEAIDAVFAVDESRIRFRHVDDTGRGRQPKLHNVLLIGGNGEDIISDWHCGNASFNACVERVAMNVEDLLNVVLKTFEPCPVAAETGEACTRPAGHKHDTRYDKEFHESGSPSDKRW